MNNEREITYICEECFCKIPVTMKVKYTGLNSLRDKVEYMKIDGINGGHLHGICPYCNTRGFFFSVDKAMGTAVSVLNRKGYTTEFSCQGHSYVEFKKNINKNSYHIAYLYDRPYITINSSCTKKAVLKTFIKYDFNEFLIGGNEIIITKDNIDNHFDTWQKALDIAIYLNEEKIERQYKKVVKEFEGRKASTEILNKIDEKIDKYFEYKCNQLGLALDKLFNLF